MAIQFQCPCGRALIADDAHRGQAVKCPACGRQLSVPSASGATPAVNPSCPRCAASLPAEAKSCPQCGAFVDGAPLPSGLKACPRCAAQVSLAEPTCRACGALLEVPSNAPAPRPGLPWEHRETLGLWPAAGQTLKLVLFSPGEAFSRMQLDNPLGSAFLFLVIFGCGGAVIGAIWNAVFQGAMMSFISKFAPPGNPATPMPFSPAMMGLFQGVFGVLVAPFAQLIAWLLYACTTHLGLLVTGANRRDFGVTLAVYAYALGATGVLQAFPGCGGLVALFWMPVIAVIGLVHAHGAETWKAVVALLWPIVLCCCCGGAAAVAIPAMLAAK